MKTVKKALLSLFFITFSLPVFSQTSICNSVFNFLKLNKCNPHTQQIISSNINQFPYIISSTFPAKTIGEELHFSEIRKLYMIFSQEEVLENKEIFETLINYVKHHEFSFNIEMIFLYGENQKIEKRSNIYALNTVVKSINTNENATAIFVNLNKSSSSIISTSNGITAPSWLIKNEHDIFAENNTKSGLPFYYISQLYSYPFNKNRQLDAFFELQIPGIVLNFNTQNEINTTFSNESPKVISKILIDSISAFANSTDTIWDQHFLMINLMGKYRLLSEFGIIQSIIIIIISFLLIISLLGFINTNFKRDSWNKIIKIWYVVPITFVIVVISFFIGKLFSSLFIQKLTNTGNLYFLCCSQLIISFVFVSVYYFIQIIINNKYNSHSIDFMIIITIFINQFIFLFIDISLFPLFMFGCILAILSLAIKNNIVHIVIFLITFIPFGLYAHTLVKASNVNELYNYLISNNNSIIFISLVLYPAFLIYFRILSAFKETFTTKKSLYISCSITIAVVLIVSVTTGIVRTAQINKHNLLLNKTEKIIEKDENIIISYSDKQVFDDLIRTVKVSLPKQCLHCNVNVSSKDGTPILYSSDDYELLDTNSADFLIPYCPPPQLSFSYGTENKESTITISAIFLNESDNLHKDEFSLCTKSITINDNGK